MQRTIVLPIEASDQKEILLRTLDAFVEACVAVSFFAQATAIFSPRLLHDELYSHLRTHWKLKSQMACNAFRHVAGLYTHQDLSQQRRRREKGVFLYRKTMPLQRGRDYTLFPDGSVSLSTLDGRVKVQPIWGKFQKRYLEEGWAPSGGRLVLRKGKFELHLTIEKEAPALDSSFEGIVGVDLGQTNLAALSNGQQINRMISGREVKDRQRRWRQLYRSLQANGTRGARKKLRDLQGKQQRWQSQVNHVTANRIVEWAIEAKACLLVFEDLRGIRRKGKRRTKRQTADFHQWTFYQLRQYVTYKAEAVGIKICLVNPCYTSQQCSRCGHMEEKQRNGHSFCCKGCGLRLHADLNAARGIARRACSRGQCSRRPGSLSTSP